LWEFKDFVISTFNIPGWVYALIPEQLGEMYDLEFAVEINAISELSQIEFGMVFFINFMYEF